MATSSAFALRLARATTAITTATRSWRIILALLVVAVSWLALSEAPPLDLDTGWDKLNHMVAFTALAFVATLGFPISRARRALVLCALLAFGGLIEVGQLWVPGRSADWADLLADAVGVASGATAAGLLLAASSALSMRTR